MRLEPALSTARKVLVVAAVILTAEGAIQGKATLISIVSLLY